MQRWHEICAAEWQILPLCVAQEWFSKISFTNLNMTCPLPLSPFEVHFCHSHAVTSVLCSRSSWANPMHTENQGAVNGSRSLEPLRVLRCGLCKPHYTPRGWLALVPPAHSPALRCAIWHRLGHPMTVHLADRAALRTLDLIPMTQNPCFLGSQRGPQFMSLRRAVHGR